MRSCQGLGECMCSCSVCHIGAHHPPTQVTTDIPDHHFLKHNEGRDLDGTARGLGATLRVPMTTCAEENLLMCGDMWVVVVTACSQHPSFARPLPLPPLRPGLLSTSLQLSLPGRHPCPAPPPPPSQPPAVLAPPPAGATTRRVSWCTSLGTPS